MPSKITLDSDTTVIRRLFALNPATQAPVPEGQVPVMGSNGQLRFYSTIEYFSTISSATATDSVLNLLNYVQPGLSSISSQTGFLTNAMQSTINDQVLSSFSSILEPSLNYPLTSTVAGLGNIYISSVFTDPTSIAVYGFTLSDGSNSAEFTLSSPFLQINNDYLPTSTSLISTVAGLGSAGYVSTNVSVGINPTLSSVKGYALTVLGEQSTFNSITISENSVDDIKYGSSLWVAATYNGSYWSSNLTDWNGPNAPALVASIDYDSIANRWVAATTNGINQGAYSGDGSNWTTYSAGILNFNTIYKVLHTTNGWYFAGVAATFMSGSNNSSIMYSLTGDDDTNWFAMAGGVGLDYARDIAFDSNSGSYMAVGSNASPASNVVVSIDGSNWTYAASDPGNFDLQTVATNSSNTWVVTGTNNVTGYPSFLVTSNFGSNWTDYPFTDIGGVVKVRFVNGSFYAMTQGFGSGPELSTLLKSATGVSWTPIPVFGDSIIPQAITFGSNTYAISAQHRYGQLNSSITVSQGSDSNWTFTLPGAPSTLSTVITTRWDTPDEVQFYDTFSGIPSTVLTQTKLNSTIVGLGSAGYDSTLNVNLIRDSLGSFGYVSSIISSISTLVVNYSTVIMDAFSISTSIDVSPTAFVQANATEVQFESTFRSTITGIDAYGFLNFKSTTEGLGSADYFSTASLVSSFLNITNYGYVDAFGLGYSVSQLDGFISVNQTTPSYLRIPPPYQSTSAFHIYLSSLTISGDQYVSTPINNDTSRIFSTVTLDIGGYSNVFLPTSKMTIEVPINTSFEYHDCVEQQVLHSWFLQDANNVQKGVRTNYVSFISSVTNSNVQYGSLQWLLSYNDLVNPTFAPPFTLMFSTSASQPFSTVMNMNIASTSVMVKLNNLNR